MATYTGNSYANTYIYYYMTLAYGGYPLGGTNMGTIVISGQSYII